ncbi:hypothetical protein BpHYR1_009460 [Brachionus plicatilis]|uniref:Uncharacterized protein n=1 Tax=Brachionus plicatilis TaxID=10195 RepID=A0A3M7QEN4_BRAPC|nr:hypothetical protein BpHYR1_009460 [Brachionus plicatilis]
MIALKRVALSIASTNILMDSYAIKLNEKVLWTKFGAVELLSSKLKCKNKNWFNIRSIPFITCRPNAECDLDEETYIDRTSKFGMIWVRLKDKKKYFFT